MDFIAHLAPERGLDLIVADLNAFDETYDLAPLVEPVDFLFSVHVLEHMIEPRRLLRFARKLLASGGHFVIEVPDHALTHPRNVPGDPSYIILVAPEHLQYFSLESLSRLVTTCGFEVVKAERTVSYEGRLPRLKMLLKPAPATGVGAVVAYCTHRNHGHWPTIATRVSELLADPGPIALWGCSYGLLEMLGAEPALEKHIREQHVVIFDNKQSGKTFLGMKIRDQESLADFAGTVILTPALQASRDSMRAHAASLGIPAGKLKDPYA